MWIGLMECRSFPESVESTLQSKTGCGHVFIANWIPTAKVCFCQECKMEILIEQQFGMTLQPCREGNYEDSSTLSSVGSRNEKDHARTLALQDMEKAWLESEADYFSKIIRLAKEIKPKFIFLENTKGILSNGGIEVIEAITCLGYSVRWITKSCKEIGSPQNRERWFMLAYSQSERQQKDRFALRETQTQPGFNNILKYEISDKREESPSPFYRVDDDVSFRVERVKALGNSVCVEQTKEAFKELIGIKVAK